MYAVSLSQQFSLQTVCMICVAICKCEYVDVSLKFYLVLNFVVIPSINSSIHNEVRNQKDNVTFLCQAVSEPVPDISWYFNGVMINVSDNSSKYMIMSRSLNISTTENTLTVYNVTSSDVGTYTCDSSNIIGSVTSSAVLTVTSKFDIDFRIKHYFRM